MDDTTRGYLECALWSDLTCDDDPGTNHHEPLDRYYGLGDIPAAVVDRAANVCAAFVAANAADVDASDLSDGDVGHNLWLSRNGHGTGFWDRGLGDVGDRLHAAAEVLGETSLIGNAAREPLDLWDECPAARD